MAARKKLPEKDLASPAPKRQMSRKVMKATKGGIENPTSIGSATGGAGAGKIKFNEF